MFCKIVAGGIPAHKIMEDGDFVAFLGIFPQFEGMTVIASKKHAVNSYLYQSLTDDQLSKMHLFAKKTALLIDKALGSSRCIQVMEGFETVHPHLKLFPVYKDKTYDHSYEGKNRASNEELEKVAQKIRKEAGQK